MTSAGDLEIQGIEDIEPLDVEGSAIYRGRQTTHNRSVAIKVLDQLQEPLVPRRFDLRRKTLNRFADDPGVVSVYASGVTANGHHYLVMPYFRIGSLADQLAHGPMPWHRAAELIRKAADIVGRGHELGVTLGDLKPSSILLADAGSPLIAVYGMATRRFDNGSPSYAAPETLTGATPTPSADVYSLALTLAAIIAGRAPNRGLPSREFMAEVEALAPVRIVEVIEHGLSENRTNRFGTGAHLATALTAALDGEPLVSPVAADEPEVDPLSWETLLATGPNPDPAPTATAPTPANATNTADATSIGLTNGVAGTTVNGAGNSTRRQSTPSSNGQPEPEPALPVAVAVATAAIDHRSADTGGRGPTEGQGHDQVDLVVDLTAPGTGAAPDLDLRADVPRWEIPPVPSVAPTPPRRPSAPPMMADDATVGRAAGTGPADADGPMPPRLPTAPTGRLLDPEEPDGDGILATDGDETMPFRSFERQHLATQPESPLVRVLDGLQSTLFNQRRSYGGVLALLSFAAIAGLVGWLVLRDLRTPPAPPVPNSSFTTFIDSSDGAARPTSDIPMLIEPASTNSTTTTARPRPRPQTTTAPPDSTAPPPAPTTAAPSTAAPTTAPPSAPPQTRPPIVTTPAPTGSAPSVTISPINPTPSTTGLPTVPPRPRRTTTTSTPPPPPSDNPEGLTRPLIERAEVTRIRATSARVGVTSPSCVSAVFSYAAVGSSPSQVSSSTCSTAHTLLLGVVTPSLRAGTSYTVTVTVTDTGGHTANQTLAFTTLG